MALPILNEISRYTICLDAPNAGPRPPCGFKQAYHRQNSPVKTCELIPQLILRQPCMPKGQDNNNAWRTMSLQEESEQEYVKQDELLSPSISWSH